MRKSLVVLALFLCVGCSVVNKEELRETLTILGGWNQTAQEAREGNASGIQITDAEYEELRTAVNSWLNKLSTKVTARGGTWFGQEETRLDAALVAKLESKLKPDGLAPFSFPDFSSKDWWKWIELLLEQFKAARIQSAADTVELLNAAHWPE